MAKRTHAPERGFNLACLAQNAPNVGLLQFEFAAWEQSRLLALFLKNEGPEPDSVRSFHFALMAVTQICRDLAMEGVAESSLNQLAELGFTISGMFAHAPDDVPDLYFRHAEKTLGLKPKGRGITRCAAIFEAWVEKCEYVAYRLLHSL